jgi:phosphoribosylformylglycinamidine synthase
MIELAGASAVSDFRIAKLRPALETLHPGIGAITARFIHFVDLERDLDPREHELLDRLLTYGPREISTPSAPGASVEIIVIPRFGTISPWSSKATDIAIRLGLDAVRRIERGIVWQIESPKSFSS